MSTRSNRPRARWRAGSISSRRRCRICARRRRPIRLATHLLRRDRERARVSRPRRTRSFWRAVTHSFARGNVASARLFYERAANAGEARAALRVGATFDPAFLGPDALRGVRSDPAEASYWYRRASDLGEPEAERRLKSLETKWGREPAMKPAINGRETTWIRSCLPGST
jgi:hypothetical protein